MRPMTGGQREANERALAERPRESDDAVKQEVDSSGQEWLTVEGPDSSGDPENEIETSRERVAREAREHNSAARPRDHDGPHRPADAVPLAERSVPAELEPVLDVLEHALRSGAGLEAWRLELTNLLRANGRRR